MFALQKAAGLGRDGVVGPKTAALDAGKIRPRITSGRGFEVDLSRQLLIATADGRLHYILNTSTGSGKRYYSGGRWKTATTRRATSGCTACTAAAGERTAGNLYRPGYYMRLGDPRLELDPPIRPARLQPHSVAAADMLWSRNWFRKGRRVLIR